jgi:hypothetical protein
VGSDAIVDINFFAAPSLLIFAGIVIFVVAFLGCFGAAKKNHFLLMTVSARIRISGWRLIKLPSFILSVWNAHASYVHVCLRWKRRLLL